MCCGTTDFVQSDAITWHVIKCNQNMSCTDFIITWPSTIDHKLSLNLITKLSKAVAVTYENTRGAPFSTYPPKEKSGKSYQSDFFNVWLITSVMMIAEVNRSQSINFTHSRSQYQEIPFMRYFRSISC